MMCALPRLGLAVILATTASASACASDLDEGVTRPPREAPSRVQIYDRDRTLVAGLATSLALGIVGLGTVLASGIYAAPGSTDPHPVPRAILIAGGVMSLGFITTIPFAIGVERHRARYPEYFPGGRGRTRGLSLRAPAPPLRPVPTPHGL